MNKYQNVHILVEGPSEAAFVREVLKPYCSLRGVFITASVLSKLAPFFRHLGSQFKPPSCVHVAYESLISFYTL